MKAASRILGALLLVAVAVPAVHAADLPLVTIQSPSGPQTWSLSIQVLVLMTLLTVLPAIVLSMTAFPRIMIVLAILRQALGMPQTPPNQVLIGLALFLSFFVMSPVLDRIYAEGVRPYLDQRITLEQGLVAGVAPLRQFMLSQVRESDLARFNEIAGGHRPESVEAIPLTTLVPAFMISELKTAFQIGFIIFIPFVVIDLVVASVLMSMGMVMLSPMLVSLPFKLMLFVLVDGWSLLAGTLAASFAAG
ncbi:MAG TPA: flagellar type III secretion system pore protein FliP [Steroidobacteraceae bacterium]|nr:flagellar type III secretion system pore protein FliP [Steroidobacteraceae bacterium]